MVDLWMPGAVKHDLSSGDGKMQGGVAKVVWHRTANKNADGKDNAGVLESNYFKSGGKGAAPHLVWDPFTGEIWQFFPANYRSLALRTGAGNPNRAGKYVIQIEIVFENGITRFGKKYATVADTPLKNLDKIMAWLRSLGVLDTWPGGSPTSDVRDTVSWETFTTKSGHYGHNQVPYNDHVDPGKMPTSMFSLGTTSEPKPTEPQKEAEPVKYVWYKAVKGDTQSKIARMYGVSLDRLQGWNGLKTSSLAVGQVLGVLLSAVTAEGPGVKKVNQVIRTWYTVKKGDTLTAIAKKHGVSVARIVAWNALTNADRLAVGQKLIANRTEAVTFELTQTPEDVAKMKGQTATTPPTPTTPTAAKSISFGNVYYGGTNGDIKAVQTELNNRGAKPKLALDGNYGNLTKAAVTAFQKAAKITVDGVAGPQTLTKLGFKDKPSTSTGSVTKENYESRAEPKQNMTRTYYGGRLVNQRTKEMLERAASIYGRGFTLTQGSYNRGGVQASAGTHDGGGAVDINSNGLSIAKAIEALRMAGFAAWYRTPAEGFAPHIHAIAIGDKELSRGAKAQVPSYFAHRSALVSNRVDPYPLRWPDWVEKYR